MLAVVAALPLAACGSLAPAPPATVANGIAAVEIALTNAEILALDYTTLPRCMPQMLLACSDPAIVQKIKDYDNRAYAAVTLARRNQTMIGVAWTAISAFSDTVSAAGH
jgi:hypothetical protein